MQTSAPDKVNGLQRAWDFTQNFQKYFGKYNTDVRSILDESLKNTGWIL